jgi:type II secretory pathway component PulF
MASVQEDIIGDAPPVAEALVRFLEFLLTIFGGIAMIMLVFSGIAYFFASGNEQTQQIAKRSMYYSVIGIVVALGAILIVRTIGSLFSAGA